MISVAVRPALADRLRPWLAGGVAGRTVTVEAVDVAAATGRRLPAEPSGAVVATGVLAGRPRRLSAAPLPGGREVRVEGGGAFAVADAGDSIRQLWFEPSADPAAGLAVELEVVLGPVLVLALARQRVHCLHAAAACACDGDREGAVMLVGPSGVGKSTLAAAAPGQRLSDDVTPVTTAPAPAVYADFPQLKLAPGSVAGAPSRPLAAVLLLAPFPVVAGAGDPADRQVRLEPVAAGDAVTALVSHTVGSRLLAPTELPDHLAVCAELAAAVPVYRLAYPRRLELLGEVWRAIAATTS